MANLGINSDLFVVIKIKKSPAEGRGNLMFSQRNSPYCDLLHFSMTNIRNKKFVDRVFWK